MYSLIIPVYKNRASLPELVETISSLNNQLQNNLEAVFVVDGSPDDSYRFLERVLPEASFKSQLINLSRNFGSFAAIFQGLKVATGSFFAVIAADLQEPPELALRFFKSLANNEADVVIGTRQSRQDSISTRISSAIFWNTYRTFIQSAVPKGGVDVFGCNKSFRDELTKLNESHSSLIGLIFWLGFRLKCFSYDRRERKEGKSAWSLRRKIKYFMDSIFSFSDLPIKLLMIVGAVGLLFSVVLSAIVLFYKLTDSIEIPGYAGTVLIVLFFGSLNIFSMGILGSYVWRAYENTKMRPNAVIQSTKRYKGKSHELFCSPPSDL